MVTRENTLENWQLCTYFTENVLDHIETFGIVLKIVTDKNAAKHP